MFRFTFAETRGNFCVRYVTASCGCFADSTAANERYARESGRIPQSHRNSIRSAWRAAPMQAFAELLAVIITWTAIVAVINQSLTLPDSCIAIYTEYLACAIYTRACRARFSKSEYDERRAYTDCRRTKFCARIKINLDNRIELCVRETQCTRVRCSIILIHAVKIRRRFVKLRNAKIFPCFPLMIMVSGISVECLWIRWPIYMFNDAAQDLIHSVHSRSIVRPQRSLNANGYRVIFLFTLFILR